MQRDVPFPQRLERILESAAARARAPSTTRRPATDAAAEPEHSFPLTHLVAAAVADIGGNGLQELKPASRATDLTWARQVLDTVEQRMHGGATSLRPLAQAVQIEIAVAMAENDADRTGPSARHDPLFRLHLAQWAMKDGILPELVPVRDPQLRIVEFDFDASQFMGAQTVAAFPAVAAPRRSFIATFGCSEDGRRAPLLVDKLTARILRLSDGTLTTSEILAELSLEDGTAAMDDSMGWVENLFRLGLVALQDVRVVVSVDCSRPHDAVTEFRA
jgi:hypothetical protein